MKCQISTNTRYLNCRYLFLYLRELLMDIKKKLKSYKNKTIVTDDIHKMTGYIEYEAFVYLINELINNEDLEPVKASGLNGRVPPLFNKYRKIKEKKDYTNALEEIKKLHPKFEHNRYLNNPKEYIKYRDEILALSKFLWIKGEELKKSMSLNERSLQIWGKEKLIKETSTVQSIFNYNHWDMSMLNYFETPEPFFDYTYSNKKDMNILIVENKDTWFSLRKIMREEELNYLFRKINIILYGEGKKIIRKRGRLEEYNGMLKGSINRYFYFGDLDYEGIDIFQILKKYNKNLEINLFVELYSWMLRESKNVKLPNTKKGQKKINIDEFLCCFDEDDEKMILNILENGLYIPQEILNYQLLKTKMKEGL